MKRMDTLSKMGNTTDTHRLDELSSALDRYSTGSLVAYTVNNKRNVPFVAYYANNIALAEDAVNAKGNLLSFMVGPESIWGTQHISSTDNGKLHGVGKEITILGK